MKPVLRALADATRRLEATSDTHRLDAELLMAAALGIERDTLLLDPPGAPVPESFPAMIERRLAGEPVAYITGKRAFWNIELLVGPGAWLFRLPRFLRPLSKRIWGAHYVRIPWSEIASIGETVTLRSGAATLGLGSPDRKLGKWIAQIPGA